MNQRKVNPPNERCLLIVEILIHEVVAGWVEYFDEKGIKTR
jgi:hypothetical protein